MQIGHASGGPSRSANWVPHVTQIDSSMARTLGRDSYGGPMPANHVSQPTASRPELVAGYYDALRAACAGCTIVAGDMLGSGSAATPAAGSRRT